MILPSKHLPIKKSLVGCGAHVVALLKRPRTLEQVWRELRDNGKIESLRKLIATVDALYILGIVETDGTRLRLVRKGDLQGD
jgi:hypothetical protein